MKRIQDNNTKIAERKKKQFVQGKQPNKNDFQSILQVTISFRFLFFFPNPISFSV